jgi:uncharacterized protein DUF4386
VNPDSAWKGLYRGGGLALFVAGSLLLLAILLGILVGQPPELPAGATPEQTLQFIAANRASYLSGQFGQLVIAILLVPGALALFASLQDVHRGYAAVGAALIIVAVAMTLSNLATPLSLVTLADKYVGATSDAERAAQVATATTVTAMGTDNFTELVIDLGFLLFSLAMLGGVFPRPFAYVGIVLGGVGVISNVGGPRSALEAVGGLASVLLVVFWCPAAGYWLYRLAGLMPAPAQAAPRDSRT